MGQYLLSTYRVDGEVPGAAQGSEEMQSFMERVIALEDQMQTSGSFVFGGGLRDSDAASVVYAGDALVTDGPFAEAKEQIAGFYVINAEDDDEARPGPIGWPRQPIIRSRFARSSRPVC